MAWGDAIVDSICMPNKMGFRPQILRRVTKQAQQQKRRHNTISALVIAHVLPVDLR